MLQVRRAACSSAGRKIISTLTLTDALKDDTSIIVIDLTPPGNSFSQVRPKT